MKTLAVLFLACLLAWCCRTPEKKTPASDSTAIALHPDSLPNLPVTKEVVTPIVDVYAGKYDRAQAILDTIFPHVVNLSAELVVKNFLNIDALDTPGELMLYTVDVRVNHAWTHYFAVFDFSDSVKFVAKAQIYFSNFMNEEVPIETTFIPMELAPGHMAAYGSQRARWSSNENTEEYEAVGKELWGLAGGEIVSLLSFTASSSTRHVDKQENEETENNNTNELNEQTENHNTNESFGSLTAGKMCSIELTSQPQDNDVDGTYKFDGKKYVKVSR